MAVDVSVSVAVAVAVDAESMISSRVMVGKAFRMRSGLERDTYSRRKVRGDGISCRIVMGVDQRAATSDENSDRFPCVIVMDGLLAVGGWLEVVMMVVGTGRYGRNR